MCVIKMINGLFCQPLSDTESCLRRYVKVRGAWFDLGCWPLGKVSTQFLCSIMLGKMHNVAEKKHSVCTHLSNPLKFTKKTHSMTVMQACSLLHSSLFRPSLTDFLHTDTKAKLDNVKLVKFFYWQLVLVGKFDARHRVRLGTAT